MIEPRLNAIRDAIGRDIGKRGLATDPADNLLTRTTGDFAAACASVAGTPGATVGVVTGFFIPHADPPCGETDGPLGALFLARALLPLGVQVSLLTDDFCAAALRVGLETCGLAGAVPLVTLPSVAEAEVLSADEYCRRVTDGTGPLTHLVALERVGPGHTPTTAKDPAFVREVAPEHHDRCHTMRGRDITRSMSPAHLLLETPGPGPVTLGIGDGGNEIGMGKLPWEVVRRNVPGGGLVACRVPTDHLLVCGISNWGAYGLAAGVHLLRGVTTPPRLFDTAVERELLRAMVEHGPLVDGVTGRRAASVDGLDFDAYAEILSFLGRLLADA